MTPTSSAVLMLNSPSMTSPPMTVWRYLQLSPLRQRPCWKKRQGESTVCAPVCAPVYAGVA
eukprot:CAMPEP_0185794876 /NCGR_PEP_ID=MMETSP1174-20130828/160248_1 /TAXON_ID=35687 /ORGANISM="Dictyocha speculum, Strain CCMP1381" /LENGTH=60 /DNA_ID=CAMNT_0028490131 /DNA_START=752 /DNA_END=934 /DNA_ORIENTATION=-